MPEGTLLLYSLITVLEKQQKEQRTSRTCSRENMNP